MQMNYAYLWEQQVRFIKVSEKIKEWGIFEK